jgi:hypothetical protein
MSGIRTRLTGLLSAMLLAVSVCTIAAPGYLCRVSGEVSTSCCCPVKRVSNRCGAELDKRSCCDRVEARIIAPSSAPDSSRLVAAPVFIAAFDLDFHARAAAQFSRDAPRITHPPGPPRFLEHCAFLI